MNLSTSGKVTRVSNAVAAGTATTNCTSVDMKGFDAVTFVCAIGAIEATGTVTLKAQQSTDDSSFADLAGTAVAYTASDDNKLAVLEVTKPRERYVRPVVVTATANGTIDSVIAVQTSADAEPVTNGSTVVGTEQHLAPAEGTA
jgi:hypothetical protein